MEASPWGTAVIKAVPEKDPSYLRVSLNDAIFKLKLKNDTMPRRSIADIIIGSKAPALFQSLETGASE